MTGRNEILDKGTKIRTRAIVVGLLFAVAICALTPFNNAHRQATPLGGGHFPLAPFYILIWLTIFIGIFRKLFKGILLMTGRELLVAWILMVLVSGIAYTGLVRTFFINLTAPFHFASIENRWDETLHPLMPQNLFPQGQQAIEGVYNGLPGGRQMSWPEVVRNIPWEAWIYPILGWGVFIFLSYTAMLCLVNLLSRQWLTNERMNFPLLRVSELMAEALDNNQMGKFFSNRFFLVGISVPVFLHFINGMNFYFPQIPQIPTLILAGTYFPKHGLFSAFYKLKICIYPAFIGFAFLAAKQISFSFWFFFVAGGLLIGGLSVLGYNIPAAALGTTFGPTLSRPEETQMIGAYGVFFLFILWLARHHLADVIRLSFGKKIPESPDSENVSIRISFYGFVLAILGLLFWFYHFGLSIVAGILLVGAFFMVLLVASRVICQGGVAYFTLTAAPIDGLLSFFGSRFFSGTGILIAAVAQKVLFLDLRESLMPSLVHSQHICRKVVNQWMTVLGVILVLGVGVAVSFVAMLSLCYKFGVRELSLDWATRTTLSVYENVNALLQHPSQPSEWVIIFAVAGAAVMLVLAVCYHQFYWWPIHPIGYLTAYSSAMRILWFSFFAGWLCNALCMRYGGVPLFKKLRYFFIGLIVGDFLMGGTWAFVGLFSDVSYAVLPD